MYIPVPIHIFVQKFDFNFEKGFVCLFLISQVYFLNTKYSLSHSFDTLSSLSPRGSAVNKKKSMPSRSLHSSEGEK